MYRSGIFQTAFCCCGKSACVAFGRYILRFGAYAAAGLRLPPSRWPSENLVKRVFRRPLSV
ncbi:hypothetical protein [Kingella potus]|uniref:hypothetical protein n=1 Tax=Kingella potus TaxID=265175 RepID=UPI001FD17038|nr:hypothetical protein [Kingella potus]UOP00236.1 hypothetical protein LVJ84_09915 [Kingella potus]